MQLTEITLQEFLNAELFKVTPLYPVLFVM